jgi:signal transduction histidine kinase
VNISTRFKLAGLVSAAAVVATGAVLFSATQQVKQELVKNEVSGEVLRGVTALRYLTLEYVLRHEERSHAQWELRNASLSRLLTRKTDFTRTEEQEIVDDLRHTDESVSAVFSQLVADYKDSESTQGPSAVAEELEARLVGEITNKTQAMISDAVGLSERSRTGVLDAQWRASAAVVTFAGIVALVIAALSYLMFRGVVGPLEKLRQGTEIVGGGDLDYRLNVSAKDEIGELARAFDGMTEKLKRTTVSRDELEKENAERRRAEAEVRALNAGLEQRVAARTAELRAANRELESFAYSVSHDLRAPLRHMDGFSQALIEDYGEKLEGEAKEFLLRIRSGSVRMGQLIDDLLKFARMSRGEVDREPTDLSALAHRIVEELHQAQPDRKPVIEIAPSMTAHVGARLMEVVLQNLLGNAWKFSAKNPDAEIAFGRTEHGARMAYFVRDNGIGFDMAYAGKLFTPFQRLHSSAEFEGTGIGLATVSRIVHRHGGEIWVDSAIGKGTTVYFTL